MSSFLKKNSKKVKRDIFTLNFFFNYQKIIATEEIFSQLGKSLLSSILHLLDLLYPTFTCVDPDPYTVLYTVPNSHLDPDPQHCF